MNVGRLIGGFIALASGLLVLIQSMLFFGFVGGVLAFTIAWVINLALGFLLIIGGVLGIAGKGGGGLILAVGIISIVMAIVSTMSIDLMFMLMQFTLLGSALGMGPFGAVTLEAILMVIAGIIILVSPTKD